MSVCIFIFFLICPLRERKPLAKVSGGCCRRLKKKNQFIKFREAQWSAAGDSSSKHWRIRGANRLCKSLASDSFWDATPRRALFSSRRPHGHRPVAACKRGSILTASGAEKREHGTIFAFRTRRRRLAQRASPGTRLPTGGRRRLRPNPADAAHSGDRAGSRHHLATHSKRLV